METALLFEAVVPFLSFFGGFAFIGARSAGEMDAVRVQEILIEQPEIGEDEPVEEAGEAE